MKQIRRNLALAAVIAAILFFTAVRFRVADVPLERDEGEYAYSGQLILQGLPPYQFAYNMKFPGTYYAYGLIMAVFGQTAWGVHAGLAVLNAATILLLYFLGCRLLKNESAAAISAIAFGFFSIDRWILGVFGHATHFVVFAAVAGLLVLCAAMVSEKSLTFVSAGVLLGLSVLMKQHGIFFLAFGVAIAGWDGIQKIRNIRDALFRSFLVAAGGAIPFVVLFGVLSVQSTFERFWFWTFEYAKEYVSRVSPADGWATFTEIVSEITRANAGIWLVAASGVILLWIVQWPQETRTFLTALLVASVMAICPGFYFREHYFILLLPSAALFCGVAVLSVGRLLAQHVSKNAALAIATGIFILSVGWYSVKERDYLFRMPVRELSRTQYGPNPFIEAPEVARYINGHTDRQDRIAILGSEPEIYFYADRKSATGYIYTYPLMEQQPYSQSMQDEMIREITAAHPKYVVYVAVPTSWLTLNPKEKILTWSEAYLNQCYSPVGIAEIVSDTTTRWFWDADVVNRTPQSPYVVYTLKAKTDNPCSVPG